MTVNVLALPSLGLPAASARKAIEIVFPEASIDIAGPTDMFIPDSAPDIVLLDAEDGRSLDWVDRSLEFMTHGKRRPVIIACGSPPQLPVSLQKWGHITTLGRSLREADESMFRARVDLARSLLRTRKFLIVEQANGVRAIIRRIIQSTGYNVDVVEAACYMDAIDIGSGCDLALIDLGLADGDGTSLARRLAEDNDGLYAVIMSGRDWRGASLSNPIGGPVRSFLRKPFYPDDVRKLINARAMEEVRKGLS